jgi:hypothetical protein
MLYGNMLASGMLFTDGNPNEQVWEAFKSWNDHFVARKHLDFHGYDGIDWDIEGMHTHASGVGWMEGRVSFLQR